MTSFAALTDLNPLLINAPLAESQIARAQQLLEQAANRIRAYTRRTFIYKAADVVVLRTVGSKVRLPQRPVISIDAVKLIDYLGNRYPVPTYGFDGIDTIDLAFYDLVLNLPSALAMEETWTGSVEVTYTHGYQTVPQEIIDLNAELAARVLNAPFGGMTGIHSQATGPYNVTVDPTTGGAGIVTLTDDDKTTLKPYRRLQAAIETR